MQSFPFDLFLISAPAGNEQLTVLTDLVLVLAIAVAVVMGLSRIGLPAVAGFILAGTLMGPKALGLVGDVSHVTILAEVGVVLLLFDIGMELSIQKVRRLWQPVLLGGILQMGLTGGAAFGIGLWLGLKTPEAIFVGALVAVSSTVIVLNGLGARGELFAPHGRLTMGILLFQDIMVVPLMLAVPLLAGSSSSSNPLEAFGRSTVQLVMVVIAGRLLAPKLLGWVAKSRERELFVLTTILICMAIVAGAAKAGVSLALGAFLAGLVVADSEYRHQAISDLLPFREVFSSIFFVSTGMLLDPTIIYENASSVMLLLLALLTGKAILAALTGLILRLPLRVCILAGVALAQVGEFAFVLAQAGLDHDLLQEEIWAQLSAAAVMSMIITPFMLKLGPHLAAGIDKVTALSHLMGVKTPDEETADDDFTQHIILAGYGEGGAALAQVLSTAGVQVVVIDINPDNVRRAMDDGWIACYGDASNPEVLHRLGVNKARGVVLLINDPTATDRAVRAARRVSPDLHIFVRTPYLEEARKLERAGANEVASAETAVAISMARRLLEHNQVPEEKKEDCIRQLKMRWEKE